MVAKIARNVITFLKREDGPTAVEYAVMLALIIVVCIAAISLVAERDGSNWRLTGTKKWISNVRQCPKNIRARFSFR